MAIHHCADGPCRISPHPDLLARLGSDSFRAQGSPDGTARTAPTSISFGAPTGTVPGLNDGTIFPESHFEGAPSPTQLSRAALQRAPLRGAIRVVIVLVEFSDKRMASGVRERFQDLFFSTRKIATGSVTEYFTDASNGKISLTGEVAGPFLMPQTSIQYANNAHGLDFATPNLQTLAADALAAANGQVNFKPYDNDGNGYVDAFIVVHAGRGGEETGNKNDIWSAKWVLPQLTKVDDVNVFAFLTIPEDAKIGVSAHELGHLVFGWPDLYDTDYTSAGVGNWCVMSGGSWGGVPAGVKPCHPSAWCKANQGWVDVVTEAENHAITCPDVKSSKKVHRLWKNGDTSSQEYFLIENRQLAGFDATLPGAGLLVWHIDDGKDNNSNENHPKVGLVQADGLDQLKTKTTSGDAGDPFPGTANSRSFNSTSNPHSKSYAGEDTFVSITSIPPPGSTMTMEITVKPIVSAGFNAKTWYRLRNSLSGHALDVVNDGHGSKDGYIQMAREGNFSGQYWQVKPRADGFYALCTMFLGAGMQLDVYGNDKTKPHLAPAGNYSGQFWQIKPWGDGSFHLSNSYSGPDLYLDTMEGGTRVAMNSSNTGRPTQRWTITAIRAITETEFTV